MVDWYGRVMWDGDEVARVTANDRSVMLRELRHYAALYQQDAAFINQNIPVTMQTRSRNRKWKELEAT